MNFEKLPKDYITDIFIKDIPDLTGKRNSVYYDDALLSAKGAAELVEIYNNPSYSSCLKVNTTDGEDIYLVFSEFSYKPLLNKLETVVDLINLGLKTQLDMSIKIDSYEEVDVKDFISIIDSRDNVWVVEPSFNWGMEDGQVKLSHRIDLEVFVLRDFHKAQLQELIERYFENALNKVLELSVSQQETLVDIIQSELDIIEEN